MAVGGGSGNLSRSQANTMKMGRLKWWWLRIIVLLVLICLVYQFLYTNNSERLIYKIRNTISPISNESNAPKHRPFLSLIPRYHVNQSNCNKLFQNDAEEQKKAMNTIQTYRGFIQPDAAYLNLDCPKFIAQRSYIMNTMTKEEESFPIAYSIVVYKDLGQIERLFRAIYRPQNAYCFHADIKSSKIFRRGLQRLVSCFSQNTIMSSRSVDVRWGQWSVVEADLICMKDLLNRFPKWKYLINLTGQEFPLRTNLELVRILKAFNGSNNMEGTVKRLNPGRAPTDNKGLNITWTKGSLHIVAVRSFVHFLFNHKNAELVMSLLRKRPIPDEMLFTALNHNPHLGAPGAYLGEPETDTTKYPFVTRLKNWGDGPFNYPCRSGLRVRQICIWGINDLPFIDSRYELFINKLYWHFQPIAYDCLEERIFNHTRRDYGDNMILPGPPFVIDNYKTLSFVKNHQN